MEDRYTIAWPAVDITLDFVLDGRNPAYADIFRASVPYASLQTHALVSGDHIYHLHPDPDLALTAPTEVIDRPTAPGGTVFMSQLQHLAIKCGPVTETLPSAPIGRVVPEHLSRLKPLSDALWEHTVTEASRGIYAFVTSHGTAAPNSTDIARHWSTVPRGLSEEESYFLLNLTDVIKYDWYSPPPDIVAIHKGVRHNGAGTRGTSFTTRVFVDGETRPLGYASFGALARVATNKDTSLDTLKLMVRPLTQTTIEFLGYCGLFQMESILLSGIDLLEKTQSREAFVAIASRLAFYINVLNSWNLRYFPWHLGQGDPGYGRLPAANDRIDRKDYDGGVATIL
jgi:hypothetical protein